MESGGLIINQAKVSNATYGTSPVSSGQSRVVGGLRNEKSSYLRVAVQQKTSNITGIETCSHRESNMYSSLFLDSFFVTGRTGQVGQA